MFPILNPHSPSLPIPSLWVVPVHQPQASSIVHRTWTGNPFHTWYFLPRSKHLLISWLQSPSAVILEPKKIQSVTVSIASPSICHVVMGPDARILVSPIRKLPLRSYPYSSEDRQNENHNHRKLIKLITWTTALSNSMKLWAMPCRATQDGRVMVESSDQTWSTFLAWEPHEQNEKAKRYENFPGW